MSLWNAEIVADLEKHWAEAAQQRESIVATCKSLWKAHKCKSFLDAGCGTAVLREDLKELFTKKGAKYYGIDGSAAMLAMAEKKFPKDPFYLGDLTNDGPYRTAKKGQIDMILLCDVLMHDIRYREILAQAWAHTKKVMIIKWAYISRDYTKVTKDLENGFWNIHMNPEELALELQSLHPPPATLLLQDVAEHEKASPEHGTQQIFVCIKEGD